MSPRRNSGELSPRATRIRDHALTIADEELRDAYIGGALTTKSRDFVGGHEAGLARMEPILRQRQLAAVVLERGFKGKEVSAFYEAAARERDLEQAILAGIRAANPKPVRKRNYFSG